MGSQSIRVLAWGVCIVDELSCVLNIEVWQGVLVVVHSSGVISSPFW